MHLQVIRLHLNEMTKVVSLATTVKSDQIEHVNPLFPPWILVHVEVKYGQAHYEVVEQSRQKYGLKMEEGER